MKFNTPVDTSLGGFDTSGLFNNNQPVNDFGFDINKFLSESANSPATDIFDITKFGESQTDGPSDLGFIDKYLGGDQGLKALGIGTDLLGGLLSFGLGKDQLKLGKKQLANSTAFNNRNVSNQSKGINERLDKRQNMLNILAEREGTTARDLSQFRVDGSAVV